MGRCGTPCIVDIRAPSSKVGKKPNPMKELAPIDPTDRWGLAMLEWRLACVLVEEILRSETPISLEVGLPRSSYLCLREP